MSERRCQYSYLSRPVTLSQPPVLRYSIHARWIVDINETRKNLRVEIPTDIVNAEIDRVAKDYSRSARIPGFRPGKAPARVIKQRYRDQILHDVAHDLIPRAVDDALREKGLEAVDTPDVREVIIEAGQPLTFTASFDTVPEFDPGDLAGITFTRASNAVNDEAVELALQRLRDRGARHEPVEGRGVDHGDTVTLGGTTLTAHLTPGHTKGCTTWTFLF
jgi:trigger factor